MKKRFYEGEEVVCVDKEMNCIRPELQNSCVSLVYNSLYKIKRYCGFRYGILWVEVYGIYDTFYSEDSFAPITQIEELMEEVELVNCSN